MGDASTQSLIKNVAHWLHSRCPIGNEWLSLLRRPWSRGWWFNSHSSVATVSLDELLYDDFLCLVESNEQQIEEVRSKTQPENSETKKTAKWVWICPTYSPSVFCSHQEDANEEIIIIPWTRQACTNYSWEIINFFKSTFAVQTSLQEI